MNKMQNAIEISARNALIISLFFPFILVTDDSQCEKKNSKRKIAKILTDQCASTNDNGYDKIT